jgi:site-specific recombinase XerD
MSSYPSALIDSHEHLKLRCTEKENFPSFAPSDYQEAINFLKIYDGNKATFESYRREIERLLQWSWLVAEKSITALSREDIELYIQFCINPPKTWIGTKNVPRFIEKDGERTPNPKWRPFIIKVNKSDHKKGVQANTCDYQLSQNSLRALFAVIGRFYEHLLLEDTISKNPVALIRQKSRYIQKQQHEPQVIRLSDMQWQACLTAAKEIANNSMDDRTSFIISAMYLMYLRISELAATDRWTPQMKHFYKDSDGHWWFKTLGKGNKPRTVAVSKSMLAVLKEYRESLGLVGLPSPSDTSALIPKTKGKGPVTSTRQIRRLVQACFDYATLQLRAQSQQEEANTFETATAHWLRHTGISDDINKRGRPMAHVRDDAGHASALTTDKYNDIERKKRHRSAINKKLVENTS